MLDRSKEKKVVGWSSWGFLGNGIVDTPDGGRSHRLPLIQELIKRGYKVIMLQKDRDRLEANENFKSEDLIFSEELVHIDFLFLEYRWPIKNRNVEVERTSKFYTPDYDRQMELINYYSKRNVPIFVWDKDQKMNEEELRKLPKKIILLEAALFPHKEVKRLLFPFSRELQEKAAINIANYNKDERTEKMVYIGNQYERDESFTEFVDYPLGILKIKNCIYGNWTKYEKTYESNLQKFKNVNFVGRIGYKDVNGVYRKSFCTVLIAPERYYKTGQFTQRILESLAGGCIPITPNFYKGINQVILKEFIVEDGNDVVKKIKEFMKLSNGELGKLLKKQLDKLAMYDVCNQGAALSRYFESMRNENE